MRSKIRIPLQQDNFQGFSDSELTKQKVDWKQVFDFTPETKAQDNLMEASLGVHGQNQWPDIPGFKETMEQYLKVNTNLSWGLWDILCNIVFNSRKCKH